MRSKRAARFAMPGGLTILNDCYNANPQSFRAAIAAARALRDARRLVFIAGTMRELGPDTAALHAEIAKAMVELDPEVLGAVGEFVPARAPYAARLGDRLVTAADPVTLGPLIAARLRGREVIVLVGARATAPGAQGVNLMQPVPLDRLGTGP